MVDAYQDITIPFQMSSVEFFTLVREHLNENGVMVVKFPLNQIVYYPHAKQLYRRFVIRQKICSF